jgi:hypothetical protein
MAFLTFGPVTKGTPAEIELDLIDLLMSTGNPDYDSLEEISRVLVAFKAPNSQQLKVLTFKVPPNYDGSVPLKAKFKTSLKAKDLFQIDSVALFDHDGGRVRLTRANLPDVEDMDISFAAPAGPKTVTILSPSGPEGGERGIATGAQVDLIVNGSFVTTLSKDTLSRNVTLNSGDTFELVFKDMGEGYTFKGVYPNTGTSAAPLGATTFTYASVADGDFFEVRSNENLAALYGGRFGSGLGAAEYSIDGGSTWLDALGSTKYAPEKNTLFRALPEQGVVFVGAFRGNGDLVSNQSPFTMVFGGSLDFQFDLEVVGP